MPKPFLAYIMPVSGGESPDQGLPGGGYYPDQGLPPIFHPGHPDHGLPSAPGHPDQGLPGRPPHVGNRPPGTGRPPHVGGGPAYPGRPVDPDWGVDLEHPDQSLPEGGEPVEPGQLPEPPVPPDLEDKIVAGLYVPGKGWTWKSYPMPEEHPDQGLPGGRPPRPDQGLPPRPQPKAR